MIRKRSMGRNFLRGKKRSERMKKFYNNFLRDNLYFWFFGGISVLLIVLSFFIPPLAIVDGSVLAAAGELFGFAALGAVIHSIDRGKTASVSHNGTTITVGEKEEEHGTETEEEV